MASMTLSKSNTCAWAAINTTKRTNGIGRAAAKVHGGVVMPSEMANVDSRAGFQKIEGQHLAGFHGKRS